MSLMVGAGPAGTAWANAPIAKRSKLAKRIIFLSSFIFDGPGARAERQSVGGKSHRHCNGGVPDFTERRVPEKPYCERDHAYRHSYSAGRVEGRAGSAIAPAQDRQRATGRAIDDQPRNGADGER